MFQQTSQKHRRSKVRGCPEIKTQVNVLLTARDKQGSRPDEMPNECLQVCKYLVLAHDFPKAYLPLLLECCLMTDDRVQLSQ